MNKLAAIPFLLGLALADISLQTFSQSDCTGNVISNIHSNSANPQDSSNCQALNQFQSVNVVSADSGFQCNIYSDAACQNFLNSFDTVECGSVIGTGVLCFSQALFDNPFAESTAEVTVGSSIITVDTPGIALVADGVNSGCSSSTGCDPNTKFTKPFDHFNKECTLSVTMNGNYDNTNQRDYMKGLMGTALSQGTSNTREDLSGSSEDNDVVFDMPSFVQVVINDKNGNNQAEMSVSLSADCAPTSSGDCNSLTDQITSAALGAVPAVGAFLPRYLR